MNLDDIIVLCNNCELIFSSRDCPQICQCGNDDFEELSMSELKELESRNDFIRNQYD